MIIVAVNKVKRRCKEYTLLVILHGCLHAYVRLCQSRDGWCKLHGIELIFSSHKQGDSMDCSNSPTFQTLHLFAFSESSPQGVM